MSKIKRKLEKIAAIIAIVSGVILLPSAYFGAILATVIFIFVPQSGGFAMGWNGLEFLFNMLIFSGIATTIAVGFFIGIDKAARILRKYPESNCIDEKAAKDRKRNVIILLVIFPLLAIIRIIFGAIFMYDFASLTTPIYFRLYVALFILLSALFDISIIILLLISLKIKTY